MGANMPDSLKRKANDAFSTFEHTVFCNKTVCKEMPCCVHLREERVKLEDHWKKCPLGKDNCLACNDKVEMDKVHVRVLTSHFPEDWAAKVLLSLRSARMR